MFFFFFKRDMCHQAPVISLCLCFLFFYIKTEEKTVKHGQGKKQGQILIYV